MDRFDVICIGVVLMDLPLGPVDGQIFSQETTMVPNITLTTGGDAFNEAVILSRLGKKTSLIGHVGRDMLGDIIVKRCEEEGIDHSRMLKDPEVSTRINVVVIGKDGQRHFIKTKGPGSRSFQADELDLDWIKNAKAISLASIFSSKLRDPALLLEIVQAAKRNQIVTFADMVPMTGGETREDIEAIFPYLDYFLPNLEEAAILTEQKDPEAMADCLLEYGIKNVVIKLGREGCLIKNKNEYYRIPAYQSNAVDTTGAGDNFVAGFISAILDGKDLETCGRFACAVAGISTEFFGATTGVKNKEQVEAYESVKRE